MADAHPESRRQVLELLLPTQLFSRVHSVPTFHVFSCDGELRIRETEYRALKAISKAGALSVAYFYILLFLEQPQVFDEFTDFLDVIQITAVFIYSLWDILLSASCQTDTVALINNVIHIESRLRDLGKGIDFNKCRVTLLLLTVTLIVGTYVAVIFDTVYFYHLGLLKHLEGFIGDFAICIVAAMECQFISILYIVMKQLEALNSLIRDNCKRIGELHENCIASEVPRFDNIFSRLFRLHLDICEAIKALNRLYASHHLPVLLYKFMYLANHLYYAIVLNANNQGLVVNLWGSNCLIGLRICRVLLFVVLVFLMCHSTRAKSKQMTTLLRGRLLKQHMYHVIKLAYLQAGHEKVNFSVFGMFNIDLPFMFTMMATAATHIMLLIQFFNTLILM